MFSRPKRTVPRPEVVASHQSDNPLFQKQSSPELHRFRQRVLTVFGGVIILAAVALTIFGPWFEVTAVDVTGTRSLNPDSVQAVTKTYLSGTSWLVLPRRNLWLLSKKHLAQHLKQKISTKLSVEAVNVTKQFPHRLTISIRERTPVFLWTNGTDNATIDRQGVLIEMRPQEEQTLDVIQDGLMLSIQPDQQVIKPEVASALLTLQDAMHRNNLAVQEYVIPIPACPLVFPKEEVITTVNANVNINTNDPLDEPEATNHGTEANINAIPIPVAEPCDLLPLRQKSQEIHVKIKDGPLVLFDRHSNLEKAATTLTRLLSQPENAQATYFDIRFEERVYIR